MSPYIVFIFILIILAGGLIYMTYRNNADRRTREKKRNQYNDRV